MRILATMLCLMGLFSFGCAEKDKPGETPGVEVKKTPDLNPKTDDDVDVTLPDVDVDVKGTPGALPDVDVDVTRPRDADTKANEQPGTDPD